MNGREDKSLLKKIESIFLNKRDHVIEIPPERSPVVLIVSGGLDSVVTWGYLMEIYKLRVYPVFYRKGHKNSRYEEKAVDFFQYITLKNTLTCFKR